MEDLGLTDKQERFATLYVEYNDATKAYKEAYDTSSMKDETIYSRASELKNNGKVTVRINQLRENVKEIASKKFNITHESLIADFVDIKNKCMQVEPIKDHQGNPTGEYKFNANAAIKALENLAKHIGFYEVDNTQKAGGQLDLSNLTLEEKKALAKIRII